MSLCASESVSGHLSQAGYVVDEAGGFHLCLARYTSLAPSDFAVPLFLQVSSGKVAVSNCD